MSIPVLLPTLAARFAWIIASMRYERATGTPSDRRFIPLLDAILTRLNRLSRQFAAFVACAQAGTLRASPRRKVGKPPVQRLTWPRPPRVLPTGYMWMAKLTPWMRGGGEEIYSNCQPPPCQRPRCVAKATGDGKSLIGVRLGLALGVAP